MKFIAEENEDALKGDHESYESFELEILRVVSCELV